MSSDPWVDHVRAFAKQHNLTYMCAASTPECSKSYKKKQNAKTKTKAITAPVNIKTRARPMAAVKTLTTAPKIVPKITPTPAPPPALVKTAKANVSKTAKATVSKTAPPKTKGPLPQNIMKEIPPEFHDHFSRKENKIDRDMRIDLIKRGIYKPDNYLEGRQLQDLYLKNWAKPN